MLRPHEPGFQPLLAVSLLVNAIKLQITICAFLFLIGLLNLFFQCDWLAENVPVVPQQLQISWTWFENHFNQVNEVLIYLTHLNEHMII